MVEKEDRRQPHLSPRHTNAQRLHQPPPPLRQPPPSCQPPLLRRRRWMWSHGATLRPRSDQRAAPSWTLLLCSLGTRPSHRMRRRQATAACTLAIRTRHMATRLLHRRRLLQMPPPSTAERPPRRRLPRQRSRCTASAPLPQSHTAPSPPSATASSAPTRARCIPQAPSPSGVRTPGWEAAHALARRIIPRAAADQPTRQSPPVPRRQRAWAAAAREEVWEALAAGLPQLKRLLRSRQLGSSASVVVVVVATAAARAGAAVISDRRQRAALQALRVPGAALLESARRVRSPTRPCLLSARWCVCATTQTRGRRRTRMTTSRTKRTSIMAVRAALGLSISASHMHTSS